ncbi:MAG TPA: hypothetical protein VLA78_11200 [Paracoccaceae bacterium]|nr:hypothetical protein [Paracoccaceae bacterium]
MRQAAALFLLLAACQPAPPAPEAPEQTTPDLPTLIEGVTAQCREIGGAPTSTVDATSATVTCTRPDGVSETWTLSTS